MGPISESGVRIAESIGHGEQTALFIPPDTLPSSILLAPQRAWTGLSSVRHLRDGLRIRLGDDAPCAKAGRADGRFWIWTAARMTGTDSGIER